MTSTGTDSATDRYRGTPDLVRIPAGQGNELVYCSLTKVMQVMPTAKLRLLQSCRTFETLDEHARLLCLELNYGPLHLKSIRQQLTEFASSGLLMSHNALISRFASSEQVEEAPPPISAMALPTRNRTEGLERSVDSYAACSREHGREIQFFIADQSDHDKTRQANLHILSQAKKKFGCEIFYGAAQEKEALARDLAKHTGHPFDLVSFAVLNVENCPKAYGANRNALLLSTVGQLIIQADDDSECKIAPSPELKENLTFTSEYSPMHLYFPSPSELETKTSDFTTGDVFAVHEQLLGKSIGTCIADYSAVELNDANSDFYTRSQPCRVSVTSLGTAGESTIGTSFWFLTVEGDARARLLRSESDYRHAMANHDVLRFATNPSISNGTFCCGMNLGLDNRHLLPPFTPVQRNEDSVFGDLVNICNSGYFGFLPWLILHNRPSRNYSTDDLRQFVARTQTGIIFETIVRESKSQLTYADSGKNLVSVGKVLVEWGSAPLADFEEMVRLMLVRRASRQIAHLELFLKKYSGAPRFWADDINLCLSTLKQSIADKEFFVASDLSVQFGEEYARQLQQRLVRKFGELLQIWPDLVDAANQLRKSGWQPFKQL